MIGIPSLSTSQKLWWLHLSEYFLDLVQWPALLLSTGYQFTTLAVKTKNKQYNLHQCQQTQYKDGRKNLCRWRTYKKGADNLTVLSIACPRSNSTKSFYPTQTQVTLTTFSVEFIFKNVLLSKQVTKTDFLVSSAILQSYIMIRLRQIERNSYSVETGTRGDLRTI